MRRRLLRLLMICALVLPFACLGAPARAAEPPPPWKIDYLRVTANLAPDGTATIFMDLDFNFGDVPGHGPTLAIPLRQQVPGDPSVWREQPITVTELSSPTGADVNIWQTMADNSLMMELGTKTQWLTGVQKYHLVWTTRGLVTPGGGPDKADQLDWNAVGLGWQVPIERVDVEVNGPAPAGRVACASGRFLNLPCRAENRGNRSSYGTTRVPSNVGVQVLADYPAGTFTPEAMPTYSPRYTASTMLAVTPATVLGALILAGAGLAGLWLLWTRSPRTPPVQGPRSSPPRRGRPGELGTLVDARPRDRHVVASVVDLAVRGHLRIDDLCEPERTESPGDSTSGASPLGGATRASSRIHGALSGARTTKGTARGDWLLTRRAGVDAPATWEQQLLDGLFAGADSRTTAELAAHPPTEAFARARSALAHQVTRRKWFAIDPQQAYTVWRGLGIGGCVLGIACCFLLGLGGWGLLGIPILVLGVAMLVLAPRLVRRTPKGAAVCAEALAFRDWLATARAEQIPLEEGVQVFARWLPHALALGVADEWVSTCAELTGQGRLEQRLAWCGTPDPRELEAAGRGFVRALESTRSR